jgi:hypothetical protein
MGSLGGFGEVFSEHFCGLVFEFVRARARAQLAKTWLKNKQV